MRVVGCVLVLALVACSSFVWGPHRPDDRVIDSPLGFARLYCSDLDGYGSGPRGVAHDFDRYFDAVAMRLGVRRDGPVEVWLDPYWGNAPTTFEHCIVMSPLDTRMKYSAPFIAHELVHWHAQDTKLQTHLPHVIQEGLAERIAAELVSGWEKHRRRTYSARLDAARQRGELRDLLDRSGMDRDEWFSISDEQERYDLDAIGFALVDRIGVHSLIEAANREPLSPERVLEMAGVGSDGAGL